MPRKVVEEQSGRQQAVIFDFDGTIADSLPAVIEVFEDLTNRPERFTEEQINEFRDLPIPQLLSVLGVPKWKTPILLARGRQMISKHLHGIRVHPGMDQVIKELHKDGVPIYVLSSNSTENVQSYLKWHKLFGYFAGVYGGASILGKASRLLKLVDEQNLDITASWYVGDETRDVSAAKSVGFKIASVTWGYNTREALTRKEPNVVVDTPKQLLTELKRTWKK